MVRAAPILRSFTLRKQGYLEKLPGLLTQPNRLGSPSNTSATNSFSRYPCTKGVCNLSNQAVTRYGNLMPLQSRRVRVICIEHAGVLSLLTPFRIVTTSKTFKHEGIPLWT